MESGGAGGRRIPRGQDELDQTGFEPHRSKASNPSTPSCRPVCPVLPCHGVQLNMRGGWDTPKQKTDTNCVERRSLRIHITRQHSPPRILLEEDARGEEAEHTKRAQKRIIRSCNGLPHPVRHTAKEKYRLIRFLSTCTLRRIGSQHI